MNEKCYIVTYELGTHHNEPMLHVNLRNYPNWAKITEHTWAVVTSDSAVTVRDQLSPYLGPGGRLMVVRSGIEAAWSNSICNHEWLKQNL